MKLNNGKTYRVWLRMVVERSARPPHHRARRRVAGFKSYIARYVDDKLTVMVFAESESARTLEESRTVSRPSTTRIGAITPKAIEDREPQVTALAREIVLKATADTLESGAVRRQKRGR